MQVDGNSVNYAENSDGNYHTEYDSDPVSIYDPEVRKKVRKGWKDPLTGRRNKNELNYFDIDNSEEKANKKLKGR
ncbi:DUF3114 domain-containing protein [Streptococcus pluranimalium]|uniref:DUF3114 domain-containing protein n=1 Tax=Streptococcus pluranimalium TaxID=82348 RepID=A0A2L0D3R3_9STRE|nr:DUF3114 domain-containing protein [Streptococcus pluranimalium]AUW96334.1 hypothetical protein C0J00_03985 [Streptococcus pluranimalium]